MAAEIFSLRGKRVWVAGHRGMVGSAIVRRLAGEHCDILTAARSELDLRRQADVETWMETHRPEVVAVAAARVGGILANDTRPAEFIYDNLAIETNIIQAAWKRGVGKLLFLGSACVYPRLAAQPMPEEALLTGPLEPTNRWYAIAKIAGLMMCQAYRKQYGCDFIAAMPTNLYGPFDNYDLRASHVVPALIAKTHRAWITGAKSVEIWGTGTPRREFMFVDDLADACIFLLKHFSGEEILNVGVGSDVSIRELAGLIAEVVGFRGGFTYLADRPDGMPRRLLDVGRLTALGWSARTQLPDGLRSSYDWYLANAAEAA